MLMAFGHDWVKEKLAELRHARNDRCEICGSQSSLEFHHLRGTKVRGRGRGSWERLNDIRLNPDAYILLCDNCHAREHKEPLFYLEVIE